jgi:hypothetical protein
MDLTHDFPVVGNVCENVDTDDEIETRVGKIQVCQIKPEESLGLVKITGKIAGSGAI